MIFSANVIAEFTKDVLAKYPEEACGFIVDQKYVACKNVHEKPKEQFRIDAKERMTVEQQQGRIEAVLHSHPYDLRTSKQFLIEHYDPSWPSPTDQASFIADNVPWGIVATDGQGISEVNWLDESTIKPLDKRTFAWFTADCYTAVRDWHRLNSNVVLPNIVREWDFWKKKLNTIEEAIQSNAIFKKFPTEKAEVGDIAVMSIAGSGVVNHVGVISGNNKFLHQWPGQYAHEVAWNLWKHKAQYVVRIMK